MKALLLAILLSASFQSLADGLIFKRFTIDQFRQITGRPTINNWIPCQSFKYTFHPFV